MHHYRLEFELPVPPPSQSSLLPAESLKQRRSTLIRGEKARIVGEEWKYRLSEGVTVEEKIFLWSSTFADKQGLNQATSPSNVVKPIIHRGMPYRKEQILKPTANYQYI